MKEGLNQRKEVPCAGGAGSSPSLLAVTLGKSLKQNEGFLHKGRELSRSEGKSRLIISFAPPKVIGG